MPFGVEFEEGRLYVESRQSVLFFARVAGKRLHCYVGRDTLVEYFGARSAVTSAYKYCLCAYDRNAEAIHEIAGQLIAAHALAADGTILPRKASRICSRRRLSDAPAACSGPPRGVRGAVVFS